MFRRLRILRRDAMLATGVNSSGRLHFMVSQQCGELSTETRQLAAAEARTRQSREHQVNAHSNAKHRINFLTDREVETGRGGITLLPNSYYRRQQDKKSTPCGGRRLLLVLRRQVCGSALWKITHKKQLELVITQWRAHDDHTRIRMATDPISVMTSTIKVVALVAAG
jgi:hypothetical protein